MSRQSRQRSVPALAEQKMVRHYYGRSEEQETIDNINVKCEPDMVASLSGQEGFCRAYHMNKEHWLTIILNGIATDHEIFSLIDLSYRLTA